MAEGRHLLIILAAATLALSGCNREFNKVAKSNDMDYKFEQARKYYNEGECFKAIPLFEELITYYKGSRDLEEIYYSYAYCHFAQKDFIVAAYHFQRFMQLYPRSDKSEDAAFMIARCNHEQSPRYTLDQTPTLAAIQQYQRFTEAFPRSTRIPEANAAIDELREKLHKKAFDNAMLYYNLKDYQAAATSFQALINDYPESQDVERAHYYIVMAYKLYADNSYAAKKQERYQKTVSEYLKFSNKFPDSGYMKDLTRAYEAALNELKSLEKNTVNN